MAKKNIIFWLIIFILVAVPVIIRIKEQSIVSRTEYYMGTYFTINAYGLNAKKAIEESFEEIARLDAKLDHRKPGSFAALINNNAAKKEVLLDKEMSFLFREVEKWWKETKGHFDPSVGPLVSLWGFDEPDPDIKKKVPSGVRIKKALALVGWNQIEISGKPEYIKFKKSGMSLDFGAFAKGYAVDRAWQILNARKVKGALINGGNSSIRVLGKRPDGKYWRVGISHPRKEKALLGVVSLPPGYSLSTSADNQRYFMAGEIRYSHLINPFTGYPAENLQHVTVQDRSALRADILSTGIFIMGEKGSFLIDQPGRDGIIVTKNGRMVISGGWDKKGTWNY